MENALVVVRGTEATKALIEAAGKLAAGVDANVYLLHVTTESEFADRQTSLETIPQMDVSYGVDQAEDGAKQFATDLGDEVLGDEVPFTAIGKVGDAKTIVLEVAEEYDCDHIFVHGDSRTPAGKAVFGDLAQSLILNFDGPVTTITE